MKRYFNKLKEGFLFSVAGFEVMKKELAFQIELAIGIPAIILALVMGFSASEKAVLIASVFLVFVVEIINTAIEKTVDRISTARHTLSKHAKDIASLAVFVSVANAIISWSIICLSYL